MAENHKLFNNEKINVYEAQDEVAIDVFDVSSSGTKPDSAILVTTGSYVPGAISVNVTNKIPGSLGVKFVGGDSPVPPEPTPPAGDDITISDGINTQTWLKYSMSSEAGEYDTVEYNGHTYYRGVNAENDLADLQANGKYIGYHIPTSAELNVLASILNNNSTAVQNFEDYDKYNLLDYEGDPVRWRDGELADGFIAGSKTRADDAEQYDWSDCCYLSYKSEELNQYTVDTYNSIGNGYYPMFLMKDQ